MQEIERTPLNGFTVASLLAGGGGSCTGYRMAGFKVVYANEFIAAAADTYRANHTDTVIDRRDVRRVSGRDIVDMVGPVDVLDGSPPCAAFSTAGIRNKGWGREKEYSGTVQRVDDLFFEYGRILKELRPKVLVAENVSGLVKGVSKGYFIAIVRMLRDCGYTTQIRLLDASRLGVPQTRERIIFVGSRNDLSITPTHADPLPYTYTVRDALTGCPTGKCRMVAAGSKTEALFWHTPRGKAFDGAAAKLFQQTQAWFGHLRLSWDAPSPTVLANAQTIYHPDECRPLSIPELKRVCSFPDDYALTGSFSEQWERLGRSVPPVMMYHVAKTIRDKMLCR